MASTILGLALTPIMAAFPIEIQNLKSIVCVVMDVFYLHAREEHCIFYIFQIIDRHAPQRTSPLRENNLPTSRSTRRPDTQLVDFKWWRRGILGTDH